MKKRIVSVLLALCMALALLPGAALAAGPGWNASNFTLENGEATVKSFPDVHYAGEVEVPETFDGCPVTKIGSRAFDSCAAVTGITLPETVRAIGDYAFRACTALEYVYLPPAVNTVGEHAFEGCSSSLIIFGKLGSYAEQVAAANNLVFLSSEMPFTDVTPGDWFYWHVYSVYTTRLMNGMSATTFAPNLEMSRAMLATVLYRMEGSPDVSGLICPFADVPAGEWYTNAVIWCADKGIVQGVSETVFAPKDNVTREQTVTMFSRYCARLYGCDVSGSAGALDRFTDADRVMAYAVEPFGWAVENGIINGMSSDVPTLAPQNTATRAQVAKMLICVIQYLSDEGYIVE